MRVSDDQVERSLAALREADVAAAGVPGGAVGEAPRGLPNDLLDALLAVPRVRAEAVARVRSKLSSGPAPTADDVARKLVGRLVCDRLR